MKINRTKENGAHHYQHEGSADAPAPSVTTILSAGLGDSSRFEEWRKANPEAAESATARGTAVHSLIEAYLMSDTNCFNETAKTASDEVLGYFGAFKDRLDRVEPVALEKPVIATTPQGSFGGTIDALVRIGEALLVVDWKTNKRKPGKAQLKKWGIQLGAYAYALEQQGVVLQGGAVLSAFPTKAGYSLAEFYWSPSQLQESFSYFLYLVARYNQNKPPE